MGLAAAGTLLASPAQADDTDDVFVFYLLSKNFDISRDDAILQGNAVCLSFASGRPLKLIGLDMMKMHPSWTPMQAGQFIGAAAESYCPEGDYV